MRLVDRFRSFVAQQDLLPDGSHVLCAVSGGTDSMCLLHILVHTPGITVTAAHFNHGLRGAESRRDEAFVRTQCARWNVPLTVGQGDVRSYAKQERLTVEEAGRTLRYAFLEESAQALNCTAIATAHNADDNLETVLLHLVRGAGLHGLCGIPPRRNRIIRPLLTCTRAEIVHYSDTHQIPHVEDSSNTDETYARNRLRHQVIPVLRQLNPRLTEHAAETIGYLRAENDYLNALASAACAEARLTGDTLILPAHAVADLPDALAPRAARCLLERTAQGDTDCSAAHLHALVALARSSDPSAELSLPGGRSARRVYETLLLTRQTPPPAPFSPVPLVLDGETVLTDSPWRVLCRPVRCPPRAEQPSGRMYLAFAGTPLLRPRQTGDRIALPGRNTRPIKKLLIDAHIPRRERDLLPILVDAGGVAAAAGFGPDRSHLAQPGQDAYELLFWKEV